MDPALVELSRSAGADVHAGTAVTAVDTDDGRLAWRDGVGRTGTVRAAVIVGADGSHSLVARSARVARPVWLGRRNGLTHHVEDAEPMSARDARMRVLRDGYVGIAPIADGRVNVGIVLGGE